MGRIEKNQTPYIKLLNESEETKTVLVEPHLFEFSLESGEECEFFDGTNDVSTVVEPTPIISYREDCIVVFALSPTLPLIYVNGDLVE